MSLYFKSVLCYHFSKLSNESVGLQALIKESLSSTLYLLSLVFLITLIPYIFIAHCGLKNHFLTYYPLNLPNHL